MGFRSDLKLEEEFYNRKFKPWLNSRGNDSIFIRYNSNNIIYESLQKQNDVDVILDNGEKNISLSLKVRRKRYNDIFLETISNCNTNSLGWAYYSKADRIIYGMGFDYCITFDLKDLMTKNIDKYPIKYGSTFSYGALLYKTQGRIIPLKDIYYEILWG